MSLSEELERDTRNTLPTEDNHKLSFHFNPMFGSQQAGHSPFTPPQDPNLRERPQRRQVRFRGGSLAIRGYEGYVTNESKGTLQWELSTRTGV